LIRDLETSTHTILNATDKEYMLEAIRCYNSGSYRAAVVLSFATGISNLLEKAMEFKASRLATSLQNTKLQSIEQLVINQKSYEEDLLKFALETSLITSAEHKKLEILQKTRHLCAHPSGHSGRAEEARDSIITIIDSLLSKPFSVGLAGVEALLDSLKSSTFFYDRNIDTDVDQTIQSEIRKLHKAAYQMLISKSIDRLLQMAIDLQNKRQTDSSTTHSDEHLNLRCFIIGSIRTIETCKNHFTDKIDRLLNENHCNDDVLFICSKVEDILSVVNDLGRSRIINIVRQNINNVHSHKCISFWIRNNILRDTEKTDLLQSFEVTYHRQSALFCLTPDTVKQLLDIKWNALSGSLLNFLIDQSRSSTFLASGGSIDCIQSLSDSDIDIISDFQKVKYILNIAYAAKSSVFRARDICANGLSNRSTFCTSLISLDIDSLHDVRTYDTDWHNVILILTKSGYTDIEIPILSIIDITEDEEIPDSIINAKKIVEKICRSTNAVASEKAKEILMRIISEESLLDHSYDQDNQE
jgi:hypothetical protein